MSVKRHRRLVEAKLYGSESAPLHRLKKSPEKGPRVHTNGPKTVKRFRKPLGDGCWVLRPERSALPG